jgi:HD-GYP domain-containing protein (c-di-GMP phosphodiesterase class II)
MTTDRPYRKGMSSESAVALMQKMKGTCFDPIVYDTFERILQQHKEAGP